MVMMWPTMWPCGACYVAAWRDGPLHTKAVGDAPCEAGAHLVQRVPVVRGFCSQILFIIVAQGPHECLQIEGPGHVHDLQPQSFDASAVLVQLWTNFVYV